MAGITPERPEDKHKQTTQGRCGGKNHLEDRERVKEEWMIEQRERSEVKHLGDELFPSLESDSLMDEDEGWRRGTERLEQHSID